MAEKQRRSSHRVVELTPFADEDRLAIYLYTEQQWGQSQAASYDAFLKAVMQQLADTPTNASVVPGENGLKVYIARWNNTRHGHRIFFKETNVGISIVRILHTAMNWTDHLHEWDG